MKQAHMRTAFFLALLVGVLCLVFLILQPYLVTLAVAATASVVFHPFYRHICTFLKGRKTLSALLMVLLTYVLVLIPLSLLGVQVASEATALYEALGNDSTTLITELLQMAENILQQYVPQFSLNISQYAGQALQWLTGNLQELFTGTIRAILLLFLGTIAYFYMLRDGEQFLDTLIDISPLKKADDQKLLERLHSAVNSVIRGSLIIAVLQGIVTGVGLAIFGIPSAVLLGSIAGVGALIPTIGTTIVLAPVIGYQLISGDYFSGIGLAVWGVLAVGMIDNVLHPLLVGRGMRMHPMFIFLAVLGGIAYFGIAGLLLGPLVVSLCLGLIDIFRALHPHS